MAYSNLPLKSDRQLLIKPDLHGRVLLQELEYEIDGREKDSAATAASRASRHLVWFFFSSRFEAMESEKSWRGSRM
jgi:hypothetical protein